MRLLAIQGIRGIAEQVFDRWHLPQYGRKLEDENHCFRKPDECCSYHRDAWRAWGHLLGELNDYSHMECLRRHYGFVINMVPDFRFDPPAAKKTPLDRLAEL